jgi:SAM-dependent methyltransferase
VRSVLEAVLERRAEHLVDRFRQFLPADGRVLDVGAGTGHNAAAVERTTRLAVVETDVARMRRTPRPVVLFGGRTLPFRDGAFAASLLLYVLHYARDPVRLLAEARRVSTGPVIVLQAIHDRGSVGRRLLPMWELLSGRLAFEVARRVGLVPPDCPLSLTPRCQLSHDDVVEIAARAGLRPRHVEERGLRWLGVGSDLYVLA